MHTFSKKSLIYNSCPYQQQYKNSTTHKVNTGSLVTVKTNSLMAPQGIKEQYQTKVF